MQCTYPNNSVATGFQMIVQLSNSREEHILYINQSTDRQTPASVQVEKNGTYQITIFAISRRGILDSSVEYSVSHIVDLLAVPTLPPPSQTTGVSSNTRAIVIPTVERELPISKCIIYIIFLGNGP